MDSIDALSRSGCRERRLNNKRIGDDTKAAARQNPNCIKERKINYGEKRFSTWRMELLHPVPAMWHNHDIDFVLTLTLQCGRWLCHEMPWNSPKRPLYRNSTVSVSVSILTISPQSTCYSAVICEILSKSDHP